MKLIKISGVSVQIKTDSELLKNVRINDLLNIYDDKASVLCVVSRITGNDDMDIYDYDNELLGRTEGNNTIDCAVLGSIKNGRYQKAVDIYPTTMADIKIVDRDMFRRMVSDATGMDSGKTDSGGIAMGETDSGKNGSTFRLGEYSNYGVEAFLDGNKFFQRHSAIVGNTGNGKSFAVSTMLERISELNGGNIILFDLHGEYSNLSFVKTIKIGNGGMDFPIWFLPFKDIYSSLLKMRDESATTQLAALRRAFYAARAGKKNEELPFEFDIQDIVALLKKENGELIQTGEVYKTGDKAGLSKTVKGENNGKLSSVISIIEDKLLDKRYDFMLKKNGQSYLYQFINEIYGTDDKNIKAVDLSGVPHHMIPTVVAVTAKLIYSAQLIQAKERIVPLSIFCEEAHVYIPSSDFGIGASQRRLLEIFEVMAKEGRKFGVTLCIISQRPSELNKTIMAQCANYIVMKISNEADKMMMEGILPESSKGIIDTLPLFAPGECIVIGDSACITFKTRIDFPSEAPRSNTVDFWDEWKGGATADVGRVVCGLLEGES